MQVTLTHPDKALWPEDAADGRPVTKLDLARYSTLAKQDFATKQQLDTQNALVLQLTASIAADAAAIDAARTQLEANRAPLQQRNEYRAMLDAYRVKASRLGVLEDPRISELYERAKELLYTAPTDLRQASELVRRYQLALSGGGAA